MPRQKIRDRITNRILGKRLTKDEILQPIEDYKNYLYLAETFGGLTTNRETTIFNAPKAMKVGKRKRRAF